MGLFGKRERFYYLPYNLTLLPGRGRDGDEGRKVQGQRGALALQRHGTEVNPFFISSSPFKLINPWLSLDDPGILASRSCQLTSKVANGSQLLCCDAGTYNLSSFVVCRTENTAKPAGSLLRESGAHWNDAVYSHISRKSTKSWPQHPFLSLQGLRKTIVWDRRNLTRWWFFSRSKHGTQTEHERHDAGMFTSPRS